jgi:hypothetical protein
LQKDKKRKFSLENNKKIGSPKLNIKRQTESKSQTKNMKWSSKISRNILKILQTFAFLQNCSTGLHLGFKATQDCIKL